MTDPRSPGEPSEGKGLAPIHVDDHALVKRVRSRLLRSIAAESGDHHHVVPADSGQWRPFLPGIERKVLYEGEGIMSYLLKFAPGGVLPAHRHPVDEECIVLQGAVRVGRRELSAGSFQLVRRNALDADTTSDQGAVIYLRGAPPQPDHML